MTSLLEGAKGMGAGCLPAWAAKTWTMAIKFFIFLFFPLILFFHLASFALEKSTLRLRENQPSQNIGEIGFGWHGQTDAPKLAWGLARDAYNPCDFEGDAAAGDENRQEDRKSTRLNSSHMS